MKIKVFNPQTNAFQEQVIAPKINNINRWLIGRHYQCDLILDSPEISRVHALIDYHNNQYHFLDLNSTDGSRINNQEAEINHSYILHQHKIPNPENIIWLKNVTIKKQKLIIVTFFNQMIFSGLGILC